MMVIINKHVSQRYNGRIYRVVWLDFRRPQLIDNLHGTGYYKVLQVHPWAILRWRPFLHRPVTLANSRHSMDESKFTIALHVPSSPPSLPPLVTPTVQANASNAKLPPNHPLQLPVLWPRAAPPFSPPVLLHLSHIYIYILRHPWPSW